MKEWRCFHCDEVFTDEANARLHFGSFIDSEPGCSALVVAQLRDHEEEVRRLRSDIEAEATSSEAFYSRLRLLLKSYRPFRACSNLQDVFNIYDSMEGRALAAEQRLSLQPGAVRED